MPKQVAAAASGLQSGAGLAPAPPAATPAPFDRSQKEFASGRLALVLRFSADELRQRDVEKLMAAMRASPLGDSLVERHGKTLRAAVQAGWIVSPAWTVTAAADDVADLPPGVCRWYASLVDQVYTESMTVPLA